MAAVGQSGFDLLSYVFFSTCFVGNDNSYSKICTDTIRVLGRNELGPYIYFPPYRSDVFSDDARKMRVFTCTTVCWR